MQITRNMRRFLEDNKGYIDSDNWVLFADRLFNFYDPYDHNYILSTSEILEIILLIKDTLGVDLYKYPKFHVGDKVHVIDDGKLYTTYIDFFSENNISDLAIINAYVKATDHSVDPIIKLDRNQEYKVIFMGSNSMRPRLIPFIYLITNDTGDRVYLIHQSGLEKA